MSEAPKEPPKFLSHKTNNPNKNRCVYFTNPFGKLCPTQCAEMKLVFTEKYWERQLCKKSIIETLGKMLLAKKITSDEASAFQILALQDMEAQILQVRNKEIINPVWTTWREETRIRPKEASKAVQDINTISTLMKENEELKELVKLLQDSLLSTQQHIVTLERTVEQMAHWTTKPKALRDAEKRALAV